MIQVVLALIVVAIVIVLSQKLFKLLSSIFVTALTIFFIVTCGTQVGLGYALERLGRFFSIRKVLNWGIALLVSLIVIMWGVLGTHSNYDSLSFSSLKFSLSALLFIAIAIRASDFNFVRSYSSPIRVTDDKESQFHLINFSAFLLLVSSAYVYIPYGFSGWDFFYLSFIEVSFWILGTVAQCIAILQAVEIKKISSRFYIKIENITFIKNSELIHFAGGDISTLEADEIEILLQGMLSRLIMNETIKEVEVENDFYIFERELFESSFHLLKESLCRHDRVSEEVAVQIVLAIFPFSHNEALYFIENNIDFGKYYNFPDGRHFCVFENRDKIRTCVCCGITEVGPSNDSVWICSDICSDTENICYEIKSQPYDKFIAESASSGFIVMAGAEAWNLSHRRITPKGNTAHGYAAEKGNHMIDRLKGKDAKLLGDDNVKNGPDRLVNSELRQTKYCATGRRSVNAAFGKDGSYRYYGPDNKPIQLEVPKDQYDKAVETMANKIKEGQVPGVTNPDEAKNLVRAGSLTYEQAVNITKFGTIESVVYDVAEGAIISLSAAGISFGITAAIYYINTNNKEEALRVAALQAGKTFGVTLIVYVGAQQLHRLNTVVNLLDIIDVGKLPPSIRKLLGDGLGVSSTSGINKALRGTVVTSAVLITITSGPDFLKMIRGRISSAQFIQNLSIASSGIVGGTVGSIVGGALCSPLGPAGMVSGRIVGGIVGGSISSLIATKIAGKLREDDRLQMMKIIKIQFEFLAVTFMLNSDEIESVNKNLEKVITQETLEKMFAAKNHRNAFANYCLKPVFIGVIKQRKNLSFDESDIIRSLNQVAA